MVNPNHFQLNHHEYKRGFHLRKFKSTDSIFLTLTYLCRQTTVEKNQENQFNFTNNFHDALVLWKIFGEMHRQSEFQAYIYVAITQ